MPEPSHTNRKAASAKSTRVIWGGACLLFALGATAPHPLSTDDRIRQAAAAFERGELDRAAELYASTEERSSDPGLIAFNRAALRFAKGEFREAELDYKRVLDDPDCPPERRARAWFNRGTALLRRGGDAAVFRSAIACFEQSLMVGSVDNTLKADARHNLELAKLLWAEERKKDAKPSKANATAPEDDEVQPPPPPKNREKESTEPRDEPGPDSTGTPSQQTRMQPTAALPGPDAKGTDQTVAGAGNLEPLLDRNQPQVLSEEDTREYLRRTADRLKRERQALMRTLYGTERAGVRDW